MVLALIIVPILCIIPFVLAGIFIPMPDWLIMMCSFAGVVLGIFTMLRVVGRNVNAACHVYVQSSGLSIETTQNVYLYPVKMNIPWVELRNASCNLDSNGNKIFIQLKCSSYPRNCILSPELDEVVSEESWPLWVAIQQKIDEVNQTETRQKIQQKGFYVGTWAMILAISVLGMGVFAAVLSLMGEDGFEWYKIGFLLFAGSVFLLNVILARKKK